MKVRRPWLVLLLPLTLSAQLTVHLKPATEKAFDDYQQTAESAMDWQARFTATQPGEFTVAPFRKTGSIEIKEGLIHDWAAATVVPGATVEKALAVFQNYDAYKKVYAPEVTASKLLSHNDIHWTTYLKLVKKKALTVVLDSEYDVEYKPLSGGRWAVISHSTKMAEVEGDKELPAGAGHGFLWRLNSYWLIEPRANGVYLECRTLSLTRDIPVGLGWAIKPFVSSVPKESLHSTLEATAKALR